MNDEEIIRNKIDSYMAEAGGDPRGAMRLMAIDLHRVADLVSLGFGRLAPVSASRFPPKARIEALDIPEANSSEATNPGA